MPVITLRDYRPDDAPTLTRLANDEDVSRYLVYTFPYPYTLKDAQWWIDEGSSQGGAVTLAIEADGVMAGTVGLVPQTGWHSHICEIGYWLGKDYWGRGIASEALRQMTQRAWQMTECRKLIAPVLGPNAASMRVLEKNGYTLEGVLRDDVQKHGRLYDRHQYAKLR